MPLLKVNQIASYTGNTLTVGTTGDTVTLASGASVSGFGFDGVVWTSNIVTSALTVSANVGYFVNTSSAAITLTLPASASNGDQIIFTDYNRKFATNNLTLNPNSLKFQGNTSPNPVYSTDGQTVQLVYADSTQGWIPISDDDVTLKTPQSYSIDFLVVAGGGAGGGCDAAGTNSGAGGGSGGFRTSTQSITPGTVITATVGNGGSSAGINYATGPSGSASSISGSGLTTITSAGGGGGGGGTGAPQAGASGGSGGGSVATATIGYGNTPSTSPSQGNDGGASNSIYGGGGGGGAGTAGAIASASVNGVGGNGTASSITGSSVTYAGGGGGGGNVTVSPGGAGGTGGGGAGGNRGSSNGVAGTANLGGGGGGGPGDSSSTGRTGGSGGKGVVILSMLTTKYSGTKTGSPTVGTNGSYTVLTFTGDGTYTA